MSWDVSYREHDTDIVVHRMSWTSDGSGDTTEVSPKAVSGQIERVVFLHGDADNLYDITLTDPDGIDVLAGLGGNLAVADDLNTSPGTPLLDGTTTSVRPMVVNGILTLTVSNAGASKSGEVVLYVR